VTLSHWLRIVGAVMRCKEGNTWKFRRNI